jgi:excinuclease UvrABC ATPase subunit
MTTGLLAELNGTLTPLLDVGLGYLTLDRAGASLSTGERQRIELTSTVRASTTGMLYVLDEPSVGLHPSNVQGLRSAIAALAGNGNSVVVVEHEREILLGADWVIELGPAAGTKGGTIVAQGTLRLGEPTPSLSGGESQRLRIATRLRSSQRGALYVFDEPSTGLHPLDVATLAGVFGRLLAAGATIIVIDHDLDLLAAADYLIDMGPGGGPDGGHIVAAGTPEDVARDPASVTGPWLAEHLAEYSSQDAGEPG